MFKSHRDTTNTGDGSPLNTQNSHGKSPRALRKWRRLSSIKKITIIAAPLLILLVLGYAINQLLANESNKPAPAKNPVTEEKVSLAELVAKPPTESTPIDEKLAYYDKLTLAYGEQGKYDKALESFATREAISTKGLNFDDYLNLAHYQFAAGHKDAALAALDKAETALKSDPKMAEQDKAEFLKFISKLREGYTQ